MPKWGVLKIYPGGGQRRLEGPYGWLKAQREAGLLRGMMCGTAPGKGIFVVDHLAECAAMDARKPEPPPYSLYPYSLAAVPAMSGEAEEP